MLLLLLLLLLLIMPFVLLIVLLNNCCFLGIFILIVSCVDVEVDMWICGYVDVDSLRSEMPARKN